MKRKPIAQVKIGNYLIGDTEPLVLFCGPCVIESREHALESAHALKEIASKFPIHLVYKSSYDKANRSSIHSFRGPGMEKGLSILHEVKETYKLPLLTDIHSPEEAVEVAKVCDVLQIPAFLSRQTDLIAAAARTGRVVKVKKGQFMAPGDMKNVVDKIVEGGGRQIILTDRGTTFGYNNLVSDMRGIPIMREFGYPVCFDASHSVMMPGGLGTSSGGQREFIPTLTRASIAAGADTLFIEAHPNPEKAKSDAATVLSHTALSHLLEEIVILRGAMQKLYELKGELL